MAPGRVGRGDRIEAAHELVLAAALEGPSFDIDGHPATARLGGRGPALSFLHGRWVVHFGTALDRAVEDLGPGIDAVWTAWETAAELNPDLLDLLLGLREDPAVGEAEGRHRSFLATAGGWEPGLLPGLDTSERSGRAGGPVPAGLRTDG